MIRQKTIKRFLGYLIVAIIALSGIACGQTDLLPPPENPETPAKTVSYKSNGKDIGEYKIVISTQSADTVRLAASELAKYIQSATGNVIEIVEDSEQPTLYEIVLGATSRAEFLSVDLSKLGNEGFVLKTAGNKLLIGAEGERGVLYGVYGYLERLGFRFYTEDVEIIPASHKVFVPREIDETEVPGFDYREIMYKNAWDAGFSAKQRINGFFLRDLSQHGGSVNFAGGASYLVHTFSRLVPTSKYYSAHPEYFAYRESTGGHTDHWLYNQLCLTNEDLVDIMTDAVKAILKPDDKYVSLSHNDSGDYCECANCKASDEQYGRSGTMLRFVNQVAEKLKPDYPELEVITLAYGYTKEAPKGGVVPADNVIIEICTSSCRSHTIEEDCAHDLYSWDGTSSKRNGCIDYIQDWAKITDRFLIWDYIQNYIRINAPFPNFGVLQKNMALFSRVGARGVYSEGIGTETGEFQELRTYLLAKLSWKPNMSEKEYYAHMDDFLLGYYGEGGNYLRQYIDEMCQYARAQGLSNNGGPDKNLPIPYDIDTGKYDLTFIDKMNGYWDAAAEMATDEEIYRINKARLQLTYWELYNTMDNRYKVGSSAQRYELEMRSKALFNDFKRYEITHAVGNETFKQVTDFTKSPRYWQWVAYAFDDLI